MSESTPVETSSDAPRSTTVETLTADPYIEYAPGPIPWVEPEIQACFPTSGPVHAYMHWVTQTTHTPSLFHLASYLVNLAQRYASLGMRIEVQGMLHRPRLYSLLVAPSGVGKSTPIARAQRFFEESARGHVPSPVPQSHMITADSTPNGIQRLIHETMVPEYGNEHSMFVCEEAERLFVRSRQHPTDALFCALYDGNVSQHVTAKNVVDASKGQDKLSKLYAPIVSLLFAMPEASFSGEGMDRVSEAGLIPRFLVFRGSPRPPKEAQQAHPTGRAIALQSLELALEWFDQVRAAMAAGIDPWNHEAPPADPFVRVKLSQGAREVYHRRVTVPDREAFERMVRNPSDDVRNMRSYRLRAYDQAYVIAALYALASGVQGRSTVQDHLIVQDYEMEWALNLVDLSVAYMTRKLPALGADPALRANALLIELFEATSTKTLKKTQVINRMEHRGIPAAATLTALESLILGGKVEVIAEPPTGKKGRPKVPRYVYVGEPPEDAEDA